MHYVFGDYELDAHLYQLRRTGELVELEPKVFDLLVYLIQHHDRVISKDELLDKLWPGQVVSETALTQCVMAARKAVGDDGTRQHTIKTQHGRGYRFVAALAAPVSSSEFRVLSQKEERQKAESANDVESSVQRVELSSLDEAQQNPGEAESLSRIPLRSIRATELEAPAQVARFPWPHKSLVVTGLLLLVGIIVAVQHLSRPLPSPQPPIPSTQPALPLPDKPSLAVMPFTNMSGDLEQEYFSDGLTDDLITALSHLSSVLVIARHSVFTYKGKAAKVQEIGKELGVRYVLEGSVRKTEGQVRINAQLVDATTGHHVWSERYDRPFTEIFVLQDAIVQQIVTTLDLHLTLVEQGTCFKAHKATRNMAAYDAFMRGASAYMRFTKDANRQARQFAEQALTLDPQYAEAYALLGWTYWGEWGLCSGARTPSWWSKH